MTNPHIVKAFDLELQTLASSVGAMGDFAGTQFADAIEALLAKDMTLARRVIEQDRQLDALRRDLSSIAATVIARRQPMASDLDEVLADFRIVEDLERIGDLAKNIAKRATAIANIHFPEQIVNSMRQLSALALQLLKDAIAVYMTRDAEQAMIVRQHDEQIDELHTAIFRNIVASMKDQQDNMVGLVHLLFCAKNIERIGDHATDIAEAAYLTATGHPPMQERRKLDLSSTVGLSEPDVEI